MRKRAQTLPVNPSVSGTNEIRPLELPSPPAQKPEPTVDETFSDTARERAADTRLGELGRSFDRFNESVGDHQALFNQVLGDHVKKVTGSTAASQAAVRRHRRASGK